MGGQYEIETLVSDDDLVATVGPGAAVSLWSVADASLFARFETAWEFGGRRLALCGSADSPIVIAGAWGGPGVRGYDGRSGEILWERRDLTRSDGISSARDGRLATVSFSDRPMHVIDLPTVHGRLGRDSPLDSE